MTPTADTPIVDLIDEIHRLRAKVTHLTEVGQDDVETIEYWRNEAMRNLKLYHDALEQRHG